MRYHQVNNPSLADVEGKVQPIVFKFGDVPLKPFIFLVYVNDAATKEDADRIMQESGYLEDTSIINKKGL